MADPYDLSIHPGPWRRGTLTRFVRQHELVWDLVMGVCTVFYVVLAFTEDSQFGPTAYAVWGLAIVFLAEFGARCYDAIDRAQYLRTHWLDLVTAIPLPGVPGLRVIRLLRLLRFAKVGILVRRLLIDRGWDQAGLIWPTLVLFWVGSALALWLVEHDAPGSSITSFPQAMTTAFITASTLGFARQGLPVTQDGQIISAVIVFFALGLWGFASANLTRMWLKAQDDVPTELGALVQQIEALREEVHSLAEGTHDASASKKHEPETGDVLSGVEATLG